MGLALEESVNSEDDHVKEVEGVNFVFAEKVLKHINGKVLDYKNDANYEGFTILDENPGSDCGGCCG